APLRASLIARSISRAQGKLRAADRSFARRNFATRPSRSAREPRALPGSFFWNRSQNQIAQPIGICDACAVRVQRFHRRIDPQVAVRPIGILPPLMPIDGSLDARVTRAEKLKALFDPLGLPYARFIHIVRE